MERNTHYINTDLVLVSAVPLDDLCRELDQTCCVLYHQRGDDGNWHVAVESDTVDNVSASDDILRMLSAIAGLSENARRQWLGCTSREINIGFECGDTWGYSHAVEPDVVRIMADAGCKLVITLYPIKPDAQTSAEDGG